MSTNGDKIPAIHTYILPKALDLYYVEQSILWDLVK